MGDCPLALPCSAFTVATLLLLQEVLGSLESRLQPFLGTAGSAAIAKVCVQSLWLCRRRRRRCRLRPTPPPAVLTLCAFLVLHPAAAAPGAGAGAAGAGPSHGCTVPAVPAGQRGGPGRSRELEGTGAQQGCPWAARGCMGNARVAAAPGNMPTTLLQQLAALLPFSASAADRMRVGRLPLLPPGAGAAGAVWQEGAQGGGREGAT